MTFVPELATSCQGGHGPDVRAVGWLSGMHGFERGRSPDGLLAALDLHLAAPWQPFVIRGFHRCGVCLVRQPWRMLLGPLGLPTGYRNLYVPASDCVYVAPELVRHYVRSHRYRPPSEFVAALLACPPQDSTAFQERIARFISPFDPSYFDRDWREAARRANERARLWIWKGMCPLCERWVYAYDRDQPKRHCEVDLVKVSYREDPADAEGAERDHTQ